MGQTKLDPEFCADLSLVQQLAPNPPSISLFEQFNRLTSIVVKLHMFGVKCFNITQFDHARVPEAPRPSRFVADGAAALADDFRAFVEAQWCREGGWMGAG